MSRIALKHVRDGLIAMYDGWTVPSSGDVVKHDGKQYRVQYAVLYTSLPDDFDVYVTDL